MIKNFFKKNFKLKPISLFIFLLVLSIFIFKFTYAQSVINTSDPHYAGGDYTLNDFTILAIHISEIILGVVGSLSLLMFVYGGVSFLISAGSAEAITKAKKIIIAAVIGLIIVFTSYLIIQFVLGGLGYNNITTWSQTKP